MCVVVQRAMLPLLHDAITYLTDDYTIFHHPVAHKWYAVLAQFGLCSVQACTLE